MDESVTKYNDILASIARRLEDPNLTAAQRQELKEIRAKLKVFGPTVLGNMDEKRLRALFDKHSY